MADISKVTLPNGSTYDIKDTTARNQVTAEATARQNADTTLTNQINTLKSNLTGAMHYAGVTTTEITDGMSMGDPNASTNKIIIGGAEYKPVAGDVVIYDDKEFVFHVEAITVGSTKTFKGVWNEFGSTGSLKALAFKDSASGSVTPSGTVSKPTFTGIEGKVTALSNNKYVTAVNIIVSKYVDGKWEEIPNTANTGDTLKLDAVASGGNVALVKKYLDSSFVSSVGTLPTFSASVTNETLSFNFNAGTLPKADTVSVLNDVNATYTNPSIKVSDIAYSYPQNNVMIEGNFTPQGTISQPTFTGNAATVTVK